MLRAKGKYVMFLSCDDFVHDITALKTAVELMEAEEADFLMSTAYCRHPDGYVFEFPPAPYNIFEVLPCVRQGMLFKKSAIAKLDYFDEKFKIMSDYDLIIRLTMARCKPVLFEKILLPVSLARKLMRFRKKLTKRLRVFSSRIIVHYII